MESHALPGDRELHHIFFKILVLSLLVQKPHSKTYNIQIGTRDSNMLIKINMASHTLPGDRELHHIYSNQNNISKLTN